MKFDSTFIKSKMEYAIKVFSSTSKSNQRHLEVIQNQAMRIVTGLRISTPILSLQIECKIPSISNHKSFIISKKHY